MDNHSGKNLQKRQSNRIFVRMLIGSIIGVIVSLCLAWSYVIVIKKGSLVLHPIAVIGNVFVAWVGAVVGALLGIFKRKGYNNHTAEYKNE